MSFSFAYIARGRLFLQEGQAKARAIDSPFAQTLQQQRETTHRQRAWQRQSFTKSMVPPEVQEQMDTSGAPLMRVRVNSVCTGGDGQLFYALAADRIGGFLAYDIEKAKERRLFHSAEISLDHLAHNHTAKLIACTVVHPDGSQSIGVMPEDGRTPDEIVEGDALVMAPRWVGGQQNALVFSSAGVARDGDGFLRDRAPYTIEQVNIETGALETLAQSEEHDFLGPQLLADGTLYAIRRPYKSAAQAGSLAQNFWRSMLDAALFLPRFLIALVGWANFFSWRYTGKQLTDTEGGSISAGRGAAERAATPPTVQAWGERLTPQTMRSTAQKSKNAESEPPAWVPRDWQLVRRALDGDWETLAEGVLAYDLNSSGEVVFTNGGAVFLLKPGGSREKLVTDAAIESVIMVC